MLSDRGSLLGVSVLLAALVVVPPWLRAQPVAPFAPAAIDALVEAYRQTNHVPGLAIALARGDHVLYVKGYGHDSRGANVTETTPMPIASLSKSFTSLAVMQLVESGRIDLNAPVRRYLPDFQVDDPRSDRITVRHLLTHTSGLSDLTFPEKSGPLPSSLEHGVAMLRAAHLVNEPGAKAHYHNPNYWIAARIVEVVSGVSFEAYLETHIFAPLGMTTTRTVPLLGLAANVARGHIRLFGRPVPLPEPDWFLTGASGIVTDAADLSKWLVMQNNAGVGADGIRVISTDGLKAMHAGLGWVARDDRTQQTIEHSGWQFTFTAHQILVPVTSDGIAVMANVGLGLAPADADALAHMLMPALHGEVPTVGPSISAIVDDSCLSVTVLLLLVALRGLRRMPAWAARRAEASPLRILLGLVPWLLPPALLFAMPTLLSFVFGGRDASILQMLYVVPVLMSCLAIVSLAGLALVAARVVRLRHVRSA